MNGTYPTLRPGVTYVIEHRKDRSTISVGLATRAIELSGHAAILLIQKFNGQNELAQILQEAAITPNQALEIITPLLVHRLIYLAPTPTKPVDPNTNLTTLVTTARTIPELNLLGWRDSTAPMQEIISRAEKKILIIGENRLGFAIFELLHSIGYLNTKLENTKTEISPELIGGTPFRISDLAAPSALATKQIVREYGLNLRILDQSFRENQKGERWDLIINTSEILPDQLAHYLEQGICHLQIGNLSEGKIEVGPIVIPGQTPCINCINLWKSEKMAKFSKLFVATKVMAPLEIPAAGVAFISGLVTTLTDNFFALNKSFLIGSSVLLNLLKPLDYVERFWQPNPRCGCLELA
ncbi:MAG: hypothetical protein RL129_252 [Actinomycetota bacterium]